MGLSLTLYRTATRAVPLVAPALLRRRLARGKEDPARWTERLGEASLPRPDGPLVWLNAVGLGEVLALRALIPMLANEMPEAHFLVTSTARSAARAFAGQMPARTLHQYLPLDVPRYLARFMGHWRPDLVVWTDQDLWPGAIAQARARGVPQAWMNGRMDAGSLRRWRRAPGLLADLMGAMSVVSVQDDALAVALREMGVPATVGPSHKAAAPPLGCDAEELDRMRANLGAALLWMAGPTHAEDEAATLDAHLLVLEEQENAVLILCPRDAARGPGVAEAMQARGMAVSRRSGGELPPRGGVYVADTLGDMGLWYRLAPRAFVGGTLGDTEGHNPWEAVALGCAVMHGPRTANFAADYARIDAEGAGLRLNPGASLARDMATAVLSPVGDMPDRAEALARAARTALRPLARDLVAVVTAQ